tara:strand:+ start:1353 stop:1607 length:255 start_codon:yes stop_codon:yes gene_type:complete
MMTKEQYITLRSDANAANLIYQHYANNFDSTIHKGNMLGFHECLTYLQMWGNLHEIFQKLKAIYDVKFEIVILADANGNIIKYL